MDHVSGQCRAVHIAAECPDGGGHGRARRRGPLYLDGDKPAAGLNHEVHFRTRHGAPEEDLRVDAPMRQSSHDFGQHRRLHDRSAHRAGGGMLGILEAGEIAERADIGEIHFRGLDESLSDVGEVGAQHDYLVGGLQHGKPSLDRIDRNSEIPRHVGQVQQLGTPRRQQPQEILILGQVADLAEGAHVPLKIGLDVAGMPKGDIPVRVNREFRVPAPKEALPQFPEPTRRSRRRATLAFPSQGTPRPPLGLPPRQRQQAEHGGAARQRFRYLLREQQVL